MILYYGPERYKNADRFHVQIQDQDLQKKY